MSVFAAKSLDDTIHGRVRLAVLSYLSTAGSADFATLRDVVGITDGNLSLHLKKLEASKYITAKKAFVNRRPKTTLSLTPKGRKAFYAYLQNLQKMLEAVPTQTQ